MGIKDEIIDGQLLDWFNGLNHFSILHCLCTWSIKQYEINIEFICKIQSYIYDKKFDSELLECIIQGWMYGKVDKKNSYLQSN